MNVDTELQCDEAEVSRADVASQEALAAAIFDATDDAVMATLIDGRILSWNRGAERIFGYSAHETLGKPVTMLFPPERMAEEPKLIARICRGERIRHFETQRLARDGRVLDVSVTLSPILDDHGKVFAVSKIIRDITKRRESDRQDAYFKALLRDMDEAVFSHTLDGKIDTWNRAAERLFGYSAMEIIGRPVARLFTGSMRDLVVLLGTAGAQEGHSFEAKCIRKSGDAVEVAVTASQIRDNDGNVMAISAIARDISLRVRAQAQQSLAAAIVAHSEDAIISKSPDGIVRTWNHAAEVIFGYSAQEMIGSHITRLFPPDRMHEEKRFLERIYAGETISHFETARLRKSGDVINISVTLSAVRDQAGAIIGLSKIARDITETVRLRQEALRLQEDMHQVIEKCPYRIGLWTADGTARLTNTAYAASYGMTPQQLHGKHVSEVLGPELYERMRPVIEAAVGGQTMTFEREVKTLDGMTRHERVNYVPDPRSEPAGLNVYINDITQRKLAEKAAIQNAARYRNLFEHSPAMICSIDADGRLLSVSDLWARKLGYLREEVVGRLLFDFMTENSRRKAQEAHFPAYRITRVLNDVALQMLTRGGESLDVMLSAVPESEEPGVPERALVLFQDVTAENLARKAEREVRGLLDRAGRLAGVGGWSLDLRTKDLFWSDEVRRICEVSPHYTPTLEQALSFYPEESLQRLNAAIRRCIEDRVPFDLELQLITVRGREIWVRAAGEAEVVDGTVSRIFGAFQDITERKFNEREIVSQRERLRVTLNSIGDAVITTDRHGLVEWLNPIAATLTGWELEQARGLHIDEVFRIVHEETRQPAASPVTRAAMEGRTTGPPGQTVLLSKEGVEIAVDDSAAPIRDLNGEVVGVVLVFHDVSEQRRLSKEISFCASHDSLTGLPNRSAFEARLARLFATAQTENQCHVLMYIDLDQFKIVNDTCGHGAGDRLLREVAALFQSIVRTRDTLARLGGDEFGVLLESCTLEQARRVADQLCESTQAFRFTQDDQRFSIGISIGVVPIDNRWTSQAEVMQAADSACYAAKEGGRNRVHEWVESDEVVRVRQGEMRWATEIPLALEEGRFRLYGQRIVPCATEQPGQHIEVLLRMLDRRGRVISPAAFLPAAERFNLVTRLDRWVLRQVIDWMQSQDLKTLSTVAINLSGQSIGDRSFHEFVRELIANLTFDPRKLCFEITETAAITNIADAQQFISAARQLGVKIALDDFGAGASSFGYLKNLAVDILKIDGQFIRQIRTDALDRTAVCAFRDVARVCKLTTIAEFVETSDVMEQLREIGIDFAQGFLFHQPEPLEHLLTTPATA